MKKYILYIIICCSVFRVSSQELKEIKVDSTTIVKKQFDADKIETYKNDDAFNYKTKDLEPTFYEQFKDWLNRVLKKIFSWFFDDVETPVGFAFSFLSALPYIIAVIVLYLIINFFLKVNVRGIVSGRTNKNVVRIEDDEELLKSEDLPKLIKIALEEKDYRLAVRYQYVLLLQQLSNKEIIRWEQQKTNEDYIKEVQKKNIHKEFESITRFYDFVWYGNFIINKEEYQKGTEIFNQIAFKILKV